MEIREDFTNPDSKRITKIIRKSFCIVQFRPIEVVSVPERACPFSGHAFACKVALQAQDTDSGFRKSPKKRMIVPVWRVVCVVLQCNRISVALQRHGRYATLGYGGIHGSVVPGAGQDTR